MYDSKVDGPAMDALYDAVLSLSTREECYRFFEDLCTINELQALGQRWEVARMLEEGVTYNTIASTTGASTATIPRVNRCLLYGTGGYRLVIDRLGLAKEQK